MGSHRVFGMVLAFVGLIVLLLGFIALNWGFDQWSSAFNNGFTQGYVGMVIVLICVPRKKRITGFRVLHRRNELQSTNANSGPHDRSDWS